MMMKKVNWDRKEDVNVPMSLRDIKEIVESCFGVEEQIQLISDLLNGNNKVYEEIKKIMEEE